jgi:hypothetical protein
VTAGNFPGNSAISNSQWEDAFSNSQPHYSKIEIAAVIDRRYSRLSWNWEFVIENLSFVIWKDGAFTGLGLGRG